MVLVTLLGGGCALMIALLLFHFIESLGFRNFESYAGTLLIIGPVEEMAKLVGLVVVSGFIRNELNEPADGIIYMACVALGFSLIENILYAAYPGHEYLLAVRLLVATPLHICFSALMGLSFYIWYKTRRAFLLVLIGYLFASLSHGFYDLLVFNHYSIVLLSVTVISMNLFTRNLFLYTLSVSPHRMSLAKAVQSARGGMVESVTCPFCSEDGQKRTMTIQKTKLLHCAHCDHISVSKKGLFKIFFHFAGVVKKNAKSYFESCKGAKDSMGECKGFHVFPERHLVAFNLAELNAVLETLNLIQKQQMESKWYLPKNISSWIRRQ